MICNELYWQRQKAAFTGEQAQHLMQEAEQLMQARPPRVTDKPVSAFVKNPHDYVSPSYFHWPNPNTPDGMPWILRDCIPNPDIRNYDYPRIRRLGHELGILVAACRLSGEMRFGEKAGQYLKCWFLDPETAMTPHMEHAQFVPGECDGRGIGLIEFSCTCSPILEAASSLPENREWTPVDFKALQEWFRNFQHWLNTADKPKAESYVRNNHGTWFDVLYVAISMFIEDRESAFRHIIKTSIRRRNDQIYENGALPFELIRSCSLSYSIYCLEAWATLSAYAKELGMDIWFTRTNYPVSLAGAYHFLEPALKDHKNWIYPELYPDKCNGRGLQELIHEFLRPIPGMENSLHLSCCTCALFEL